MSPSSTKETNNEQDDEDGEQQRHEHLLGCKSIPRLNLRTRQKEKQMPEKRLCPLCGDPANLNKSSKLTIESLLAERDIYRELVNNTSIHLAELKAEVEHLVIGMVAKYLSDNGFDGLRYRDCCCEITNLSPGNCLAEDCQAGYRVPCDCGDHDWHIQTTKPKEELEDEDDL